MIAAVLDLETLSRHLDALGWAHSPRDARTLLVAHDTDEGRVNVFVRLSDDWLIASVVPFLPTGGQNSFELSRWLLRQNRDMPQAKFAYDEDGDVVLTLELPTESLGFDELSLALRSLLGHAVRHRATLRTASVGARRGGAG